MDIQTRKLNIISYIAQMKNEKFIKEIEEYILNSTESEDIHEVMPFSVQEFIARIEQSEEDFKNGRYKTQSELEDLVKDW